MTVQYQARWISKNRCLSVKKAGAMAGALLLDGFNGFILVEPVGSDLGDGPVLSPPEADYELQPSWCTSPPARVAEARHRLGLLKPAARLR
jgi:hypothetical protein